jgi:hypothetical protein
MAQDSIMIDLRLSGSAAVEGGTLMVIFFCMPGSYPEKMLCPCKCALKRISTVQQVQPVEGEVQ